MQPGAQRDQSFVERARRAQIRDAAIAVIAAEGLAWASFVRIAQEAAISPALISYYFGSREELLRQALQVADARMDQAMADHASEPDSYADCLRRILVGYVQHCASHPAEVIAAQAIRESTTRETQEAREIKEGGGAPELIDFLVEGQEHGEFRQFDPVVFTDALFAAMRDVPRQLRERSAEERPALAEQFASIFVQAGIDHDQQTRTQ